MCKENLRYCVKILFVNIYITDMKLTYAYFLTLIFKLSYRIARGYTNIPKNVFSNSKVLEYNTCKIKFPYSYKQVEIKKTEQQSRRYFTKKKYKRSEIEEK